MSAEATPRDHTAGGPQMFARQGYLVVPSLLEPELVSFLWQYTTMKNAAGLLRRRDDQVPHAPARYGDEAFEALLETIRPRVEAHTGLSLYPTYSYFRIYGHGDALERHRDRPASEFAVSINLGQVPDTPWPLYVAGLKGDCEALLRPGDALIYRGLDLEHWRHAYEGTQLAQVFLQYVDRNGPHAREKYDRRFGLMHPHLDGRLNSELDGKKAPR